MNIVYVYIKALNIFIYIYAQFLLHRLYVCTLRSHFGSSWGWILEAAIGVFFRGVFYSSSESAPSVPDFESMPPTGWITYDDGRWSIGRPLCAGKPPRHNRRGLPRDTGGCCTKGAPRRALSSHRGGPWAPIMTLMGATGYH